MLMTKLLARAAWVVGIGAAAFGGCTTTSAKPCTPGIQAICGCADGKTGSQTCAADGAGFGSCEHCATETAGTGKPDCGALDNLLNCGACGVACKPGHAKGATCENGSCDYDACTGSH